VRPGRGKFLTGRPGPPAGASAGRKYTKGEGKGGGKGGDILLRRGEGRERRKGEGKEKREGKVSPPLGHKNETSPMDLATR